MSSASFNWLMLAWPRVTEGRREAKCSETSDVLVLMSTMVQGMVDVVWAYSAACMLVLHVDAEGKRIVYLPRGHACCAHMLC